MQRKTAGLFAALGVAGFLSGCAPRSKEVKIYPCSFGSIPGYLLTPESQCSTEMITGVSLDGQRYAISNDRTCGSKINVPFLYERSKNVKLTVRGNYFVADKGNQVIWVWNKNLFGRISPPLASAEKDEYEEAYDRCQNVTYVGGVPHIEINMDISPKKK